MIYRYVYKITCTKGSFKDKFYFGQHTTDNLNDGYKGSGKKLVDYYKKYPNDYIKEIIGFYNTTEELNTAEYDIIYPWLNHADCLNLRDGGYRNYRLSEESRRKIGEKNKISLKGKHHTNETKKKISEGCKGKQSWCKGKHLSDEHKKKQSLSLKGKKRGALSDEHKKKLSDAHKGKPPGNKGQKGIYIWVSNNIESKFINTNNVDYYLNLGYHKGRK